MKTRILKDVCKNGNVWYRPEAKDGFKTMWFWRPLSEGGGTYSDYRYSTSKTSFNTLEKAQSVIKIFTDRQQDIEDNRTISTELVVSDG